MPVSTIACPPSVAFVKQYQVSSNNNQKEKEFGINTACSPNRYEAVEILNNLAAQTSAKLNINNSKSSTMLNNFCGNSGLSNSTQNLLKERKDFVNTDRKLINQLGNYHQHSSSSNLNDQFVNLKTVTSENNLESNQKINSLNNYFLDHKSNQPQNGLQLNNNHSSTYGGQQPIPPLTHSNSNDMLR